jgi:hypothetical protein
MSFEPDATRGVVNHYGPRDVDQKFGGITTGRDGVNRAVWTFDYDDLPTNGTNYMNVVLPAGIYITEAHTRVLTAMAGTSGTLTIGLEEPDGTVIDVDGIDAAVAQAALVANAVIKADGALVGGAVQVAEPSQLLVTTGGTVTAGRFEVSISYVVGAANGYTAPTGT